MKNEQNNEPGFMGICADVIADAARDLVGIFDHADVVETGFFVIFSPLLFAVALLGVVAKLVTVTIIFAIISLRSLVPGGES